MPRTSNTTRMRSRGDRPWPTPRWCALGGARGAPGGRRGSALLVAEGAVERGLGHARFLDDAVDADGVDALFVEELVGRGEQLAPGRDGGGDSIVRKSWVDLNRQVCIVPADRPVCYGSTLMRPDAISNWPRRRPASCRPGRSAPASAWPSPPRSCSSRAATSRRRCSRSTSSATASAPATVTLLFGVYVAALIPALLLARPGEPTASAGAHCWSRDRDHRAQLGRVRGRPIAGLAVRGRDHLRLRRPRWSCRASRSPSASCTRRSTSPAGALAASVAAAAGLTLGPLVSGVLASVTPWPTTAPYVLDIVLATFLAVGLVAHPRDAAGHRSARTRDADHPRAARHPRRVHRARARRRRRASWSWLGVRTRHRRSCTKRSASTSPSRSSRVCSPRSSCP